MDHRGEAVSPSTEGVQLPGVCSFCPYTDSADIDCNNRGAEGENGVDDLIGELLDDVEGVMHHVALVVITFPFPIESGIATGSSTFGATAVNFFFSSLSHDRVLVRRANVFPVPVGDSSSAFCFLVRAVSAFEMRASCAGNGFFPFG